MLLGYRAPVPGNSSRFFKSKSDALSQKEGEVNIALHEGDRYVYNETFDESLIKHDSNYVTTSVNIKLERQIPTLAYFQNSIAKFLPANSKIIDIGCGQGELVRSLTKMGGDWSVSGYDPVLRIPSPNIIPRYWTVDDELADLYIMRCVLPHLEDPWSFLDMIAAASPGGLVLVEYQRLEWILTHDIWFQISHDHVNLFREEDFRRRFELLASGTFANDAWQWVLVRLSDSNDFPGDTEDKSSLKIGEAFSKLASVRGNFLAGVVALDAPIAIWGTAGKGIVLAHAIAAKRDQLDAIDAGQDRWGLHLEGSGARVQAPTEAMHSMHPSTRVLVVNPNHYGEIFSFIAGRFRVELVSNVGNHPSR